MGVGLLLVTLGGACAVGLVMFLASSEDDPGSAARVNAEWMQRRGARPVLDAGLDPLTVPLVYFQRRDPADEANHDLRAVTLGRSDLGALMTFTVAGRAGGFAGIGVEAGWCALAEVPFGWPALAVLGPSHLPLHRQVYGSPTRLDLGEFERHHVVVGRDDSFTRALLSPEVREWWMRVDVCQVLEIGGGCALVAASPTVRRDDRTRAAGEWLAELLRRAHGPLRDAGFDDP